MGQDKWESNVCVGTIGKMGYGLKMRGWVHKKNWTHILPHLSMKSISCIFLKCDEEDANEIMKDFGF